MKRRSWGRKLRLELDQPTDAAAELALDAAIDSEFNNNLRRALTVLGKEMVEMMEKDAGEDGGALLGFAISSNAGLARFWLGRSSEIGKGGELKSAEEETDELIDSSTPFDRVSRPDWIDWDWTEKFEASSLTDRLNDLIPRPRRPGAG